MNRCQRLVRSLSGEDRKRISLRQLNTLERQLYRVYLQEEKDISIAELSRRLATHSVHISRTNSELLFKIARMHSPDDMRGYLNLFLRIRLNETLKSEILKLGKKIRNLKSNEKKIHAFNILFIFSVELPYTLTSINFLKKLLTVCKHSHTIFPPGHIEAYELKIISHEMFVKKNCLVQQNEKDEFAKEIAQKLAYYTSFQLQVENPLLQDRYLVAMRFFETFIRNDMPATIFILEKELTNSQLLRDYQYQFPPFSSMGSEVRYLLTLFYLQKYEDAIDYIEELIVEKKMELFVNNQNKSIPTTYVQALVSKKKYKEATSFLEWYYLHVNLYLTYDKYFQSVILRTKLSIEITTSNFAQAFNTLTQLTQINRGKYYNRLREGEIRKFEPAVYLLIDKFVDAEQALKRNRKWFLRNKTFYLNEDLLYLKFMDNILEYHQTKDDATLKKCHVLFRKFEIDSTAPYAEIMRVVGKKFNINL